MGFLIIHVDMDAFFASVEMRDDPALQGKPLIIGSLPKERGVVSTCNYEARKYGICSAMNIKEAYRLCPHGIFMHPNIEKYKAVSRQLHNIWNAYTFTKEAVALDEAYLDVTETAGSFEKAREIAYTIKQRIRDELRLTCSVGVAYSKAAAKIASEEKKPDGYFEIQTIEDFVSLMRDRDVRVLYTVGVRTAEKLYALGIHTVLDIQQNQEKVIRLLGKHGQWLIRLACGVDDRKVTSRRPQDAKSISREVTFQVDVDNNEFLKDVLILLAICVERRAKHCGLCGNGVVLKVTYSNMKTVTRSRKISPCNRAIIILQEVLQLFGKVEKRSIRLIGIGLYDMSAEKQQQLIFGDLFTEVQRKPNTTLKQKLAVLQNRYGLDFEGHLDQIDQTDTFYKTVEYMRRRMSPH